VEDTLITITLTKVQRDALRPLLDQVRTAHRDGKMVMLIGQVWSNLDAATFGVLTPEQTMAVRAITNPDHAEQAKRGEIPLEI